MNIYLLKILYNPFFHTACRKKECKTRFPIGEKHIDLLPELHQSGRYLRHIRHKTNPRFTMSHRKTGILLSS